MATQSTHTALTDINTGDRVLYRGREHRIMSVKLGLIAGPHARMTCDQESCDCGQLTSIRLLSPLL